MHKVRAKHLSPGVMLAQAVHGDRGDVLLAAGTVLSRERIDRLQELGHLAVYIADADLRDDLVLRELVAERVRRGAVVRLDDLYSFLAERAERAAKRGGRTGDGERIEEGERLQRDALDVVPEILDDVLDGEVLLGVNALKTRDRYVLEHAVDVAAVAVLLARKMGLPHREVESIARGCLLIDIGNAMVSQELLQSDHALRTAELGEIEKHPEAGFEIVRQLGLTDVLAAHIPFQHHERQDGLGYPRGLRGTNRIKRSVEEDYQGSFYLLQVAEVAAIADVYDALCSDRPHRPALPLEAATRELQKLAGSHLNAEMVDVFLSIVPAWPLGALVRLDGGDWDGARGVVVQQDRIDPRKPFVRVYEDAEGKRCRETLQTGKLPDVRVEEDTARESTPRAKGADSGDAA